MRRLDDVLPLSLYLKWVFNLILLISYNFFLSSLFRLGILDTSQAKVVVTPGVLFELGAGFKFHVRFEI